MIAINGKRYCAKIFVIYALIGGLFFSGNAFAQRLNLFTSESGKILNGNKVQEVPYARTTSYFDFVDSTTTAEEIVEGHTYYYLYFIVPIEVEEIGVRMISPVPDYFFANAGDIETDSFTVHTANRRDYFDPWISLEKADSNFIDGNFNLSAGFNHWIHLGYNDDSKETIAQPSGNYTNSVLRVTDKKYPKGIYRIRFTSLKRNKLQGTYLAQIGLIPEVKGVKIGRTLSMLSR